MMIVGPMSMKVPSNSIRTLSSSRMTSGLSEMAFIQAISAAGTLQKRHQPGEGRRRADDQQHHRRGAHRAERGVDEILPAHLAVDEDGDQQRVEHGDAGALGRGEDAGAHAAEDDGDQQQAGHGDDAEMQPTARSRGTARSDSRGWRATK